jgi:c-di-GMP-binding flagellar brake protein YcgR
MTLPLIPESSAQAQVEFSVDSALERQQLLRMIAADRDQISLYLNDGSGRALACTLMPIGTDNDLGSSVLGLVLSVAPAAELLRRLPLSATAVTLHLDVKVQFDLLLEADAQNPDLLKAGFPDALWYFQRRQTFRVAPRPASPVKLQVRYPALTDSPRPVRVLDVSVEGIAFAWPMAEGREPEPGQRLSDCRLDLAGQMPLVCTLEIALVAPLETSDAVGAPGLWKVGCRFIQQSLAAERAMQVYVNAAQIRARSRRTRD